MSVELVKAYAQDLRSLLEEADFTERKAFLHSFIRRIEVDEGRVRVYYDLPVPQRGRALLPSSQLCTEPDCFAGATSKMSRSRQV